MSVSQVGSRPAFLKSFSDAPVKSAQSDNGLQAVDYNKAAKVLKWHSLREPHLSARQISLSHSKLTSPAKELLLNKVADKINDLVIANLSDDHSEKIEAIISETYNELVCLH